MGFIGYIKRVGKFIIKGIPEKKVYINFTPIDYGNVLNNKNIVITGGGSGIGYAIAKKCVEHGAKVLILGRNEEKLIKACKSIGKESVSYKVFDVTDYDNLESNTEEILKLCDNRIDCFVNNAGIYKNVNILTTDYSLWDDIMSTNLKSVYFLSKYVSHRMIAGGNILMIASDTAYIGNTNPYHISKSGVVNLTKSLAKELLNNGIRVNAIAPGPTISEINTTDPANGLQRNDKFRVLLPEEVAEIAMFLINDSSISINGQVICCDEGDSIR